MYQQYIGGKLVTGLGKPLDVLDPSTGEVVGTVASANAAQAQQALDAAVETLRGMASVPCTNCRYCVKDCPQGVVIPTILGLLNLELMTENRDFAKGLYSWQAAPGPASSCIACGACEAMCPQGIDIVHQLEVAAEHFEG